MNNCIKQRNMHAKAVENAMYSCVASLCFSFRLNKVFVKNIDDNTLVEVIRWMVTFGTERHISRVWGRMWLRTLEGKMLNFLKINTNKVVYLHNIDGLLLPIVIARSLYDLVPIIRYLDGIMTEMGRKSTIFWLDVAARRACNNFNLLIESDLLLDIAKLGEPYPVQRAITNYPTLDHIKRLKNNGSYLFYF